MINIDVSKFENKISAELTYETQDLDSSKSEYAFYLYIVSSK